MYIRKLDAIDSTNTYLREVAANGLSENWMVVTAEYQRGGKGQQDAVWHSEEGKNLLFSVLLTDLGISATDQFGINCAVSLSIIRALSAYRIPGLRIKWPNDIMSGSGKLGGILIENNLMGNRIIQSVIGVGLNVNQRSFPTNLPRAISLVNILGIEIDRQEILYGVLEQMRKQFNRLKQGYAGKMRQEYESLLYKMLTPHMFRDSKERAFLGRIVGVTADGLLKLERQDGTQNSFQFKQVAYL